MKNKRKVFVFTTLLLSMLFYIGWVFYMSEPTYIDNCYKPIEKFDYVSVPQYKFMNDLNTDVKNGLVLQVDSSKAIILVKEYRDEFLEIDIKQHNYRIIGKGTIYHKINNYVGMNVMLITQVFIFILCIILCISLVNLIRDIF